VQTRRLAASFKTFTESVEHTGLEKFLRKPRAFRRFFSENPRNHPGAKVLNITTETANDGLAEQNVSQGQKEVTN